LKRRGFRADGDLLIAMHILYIPSTRQTPKGFLGLVDAYTYDDANGLICQRLYATAGMHPSELAAITSAQALADRYTAQALTRPSVRAQRLR
jgi:hypothetical protein